MVTIINKLDGGAFALDGFDIDPQFQMVPLNGTRDVVFKADKFPATLTFSRPNIALIGNFRDFDTKQPLPGVDSARFVNQFTLPENRQTLFSIKSQNATGITVLSARE